MEGRWDSILFTGRASVLLSFVQTTVLKATVVPLPRTLPSVLVCPSLWIA